MQISTGLFDHIVLQRNTENLSDAVFTGTSLSSGPLHACILHDGAPVSGFADVVIGHVENGIMHGRLSGLPVGGPYKVELRVADDTDRLTVHDVLVGDVWMLAGQSNMQGCGANEDRKAPHPLVRAFYMDDRWAVAEDPIHNMDQCIDQVHIDLRGGMRPAPTPRGVGPGVAFGYEMYALTGVPQGVIASAHGGTNMVQWDPKMKRFGGRSLYGAMLRRFRKNGGKIAGVVWYQGCSDAFPEVDALYTTRTKALVRHMRRDFGDPQLPFAAVQIARFYGTPNCFPAWNSIQEQQRRLPEVIDRCTVVPAIDLDFVDCIHLNGKSQHRLGRRLAHAMQVLREGAPAGQLPITLKRITHVTSAIEGNSDIIVEFANVEGTLQALGNPHGFAVSGPPGENAIYRIDLEGNRAILRTALLLIDLAERRLYYGAGLSPYCNITDSADRSLPVFGPAEICKPRAMTSSVRRILVSECQPYTKSIRHLPYPEDVSALGLQVRDFPTDHCEMHAALAAAGDAVIFYVCHLDCPEPMKLRAILGYDGPIKVWVDGRQSFCDPQGTNPAYRDKAHFRFAVETGTHEIVIALHANHGRAWGIFLCFERTDVPQRLLKKGPECYTLPRVIEENR